MDKKFALRRSTIINKNKRFLTRFGYVYEDPKISLSNYLVGGLNLYQICNKCINGKLEPEFRGILYKMFLNLIPFNEPQVWLKYLTESRNAYKSITKELIDSNVNILPFMNCEEKKGTETYEKFSKLIPQEDYELIGLIKLDVDRTFQELDLFHNKKIKELLCKILYIYSKRNSDPSYCQGMNEILGTLFYALLPSMSLNSDTLKNVKHDDKQLDPEYLSMLQFEGEQLTINEEAIRNRVIAWAEEAKQGAYNIAIERMKALAAGQSGEATEDSAQKSVGAIEKHNKNTKAILNEANAELYLATVEARRSKLGTADDEIKQIYTDLENQLNAIDKLVDNVGKNFEGTMGSASKSTKSSVKEQKSALDQLKDKYKDVINFILDGYDKQINKLEDAREACTHRQMNCVSDATPG